MDLINWSFNAVDSIFSKTKVVTGVSNCPDGTSPTGYVMDAWAKWRVMCQPPMAVEDVEDIYIFGTLISGFALFGVLLYLIYQNSRKTVAAAHRHWFCLCPGMSENAVCTQPMMGSRGGMDKIMEDIHRHMDGLAAHKRQMETIGEKMSEMQTKVNKIVHHLKLEKA